MREEAKQTHVALGLRRLNIFDKLIEYLPVTPGDYANPVTGGSFWQHKAKGLCLSVSHFLKRRRNLAT